MKYTEVQSQQMAFTKSPLFSNNPNILTNCMYHNGDNNNDDDKTGDDATPCK